MKQLIVCIALSLLAAPVASSQTAGLGAKQPASASIAGAVAASSVVTQKISEEEQEIQMGPFSRLAFSGGISFMGINLQAASNINRHLNLRASGTVFDYSVSNVTVNNSGGTSGIDLNGNLNLSTLGVSLDYYPFAMHGFRFSPGMMLYNNNNITASAITMPGKSFTLNNQTYYSDSVDPLAVNARLGLNARQQAFTLTTGWGNMIPRKGGHWSFPFEIGAVFTGTPVLNMTLAGNACLDPADASTNGPSCVDMATDATAQSNLNAQIAKYRKDLDPLKVFPILSFGTSYDFHIR